MSDLPPWMQDDDNQQPPPDDPQDASEEYPDWLDAPDLDDLAPPPEAPDDTEAEQLPDWLSTDVSEFVESESSDLPASQQTEEELSYEDWAAQNQIKDDADWTMDTDAADAFASAEYADDDLTYQEWEDQQNEAEYAAQNPEIPLPDFDLPDSGKLTTQETDQLTSATTGEYVPEWFMGVEELDTSDAPDWLKDVTGTGDLQKPKSQPLEPPPPTPDDNLLPDFDMVMGGADADDNLLPDFDMVMGIGADTPPPPDAIPEPDMDAFDALFADAPDEPILPEASTPDEIPDLDEFDALFADADEELPEPIEANLFDEMALPEPEFDEFDALVAEAPNIQAEGEFGGLSEADLFGEDTASADEEDPAWLQGYDVDEVAAEASPPPPPDMEPEPALETGVLPDWFSNIEFGEPSADEAPALDRSAPAQAEQSPAEVEDIFSIDNLFGDEAPVARDKALVAPEEGLSDLSDISFDDDFLSDFERPAVESVADAALPADETLAQAGDLPDWMREQMGAASGDEVVLTSGGVQNRFQQVPTAALPPELRSLQDQAKEVLQGDTVLAGRPQKGPLSGIDGALSVNQQFLKPGKLKVGAAYFPADDQQIRLDTLREVLDVVEQEVSAQKMDVGIGLDFDDDDDDAATSQKLERAKPVVQRRAKRKLDRFLISVLLLVVIVIPFATDAFHVAEDPTQSELAEDALPLVAAIDDLENQEGDRVVLVAFEYSSTVAAELDPLAEAVLRDILSKGGKPVILSTNPLGILNAQKVMATLQSDAALEAYLADQSPRNAAVRPIEDFVILPYIAGGAIGVRDLALGEVSDRNRFDVDIRGENTELDIGTISPENTAFVVVIGERYEDTRIWAEQFVVEDIAMFAITTASAQPITQPYVEAGVYQGLLSGLDGALTYNAVRNSETLAPYESDTDLPDPALSRWHAMTWGILIAVFLIGLGTFINVIRATRNVRKRRV